MTEGAFPSWARVGAKVTCVADTFAPQGGWLHRLILLFSKDPRKGGIYTIGGTVKGPITGDPCIVLTECDPLVFYTVWSFRPVVPQRTEAEDVALFTDLISRPFAASEPEHA